MTSTTQTRRDAAKQAARPGRFRAPRRSPGATLVPVLAVTTSSWALNPLLAPGRWALVALVVCLVLAWATAWLRTRVHNPFVPTLLGLGALAYGLAVVYLSPPTGLEPLPDAAAIDRLGVLTSATVEQVRSGVAPLDVSPGLEAAAIGGIGVVFLLVELCCFGLRTPAWSGVALLALWVPAIAVYVPVAGWVFVVAAASFLGLLALGPPSGAGDRKERRRSLGLTATWALVTAVAAAGLAPLGAQLPGWGASPLPDVGSGGPGAVLLGSDLRMADSLGAQSSEVALRYTVDPAPVGPLRLRTMHEFDGETWRLDETPGPSSPAEADEVLWPMAVGRDLVGGSPSQLEVEIVNLREDRLPIPVTPRTVDTQGRWFYDPSRDEVHRSAPTRSGETYVLTTSTSALTAESLRELGTGSLEDEASFVDVPATPHRDDIARRAREVTADATNPYDQALMLQSYLRSAPFEYVTDVPPAVTGDAVWDFLESGRGYCVQFATAMTIMARSLGIPARMAVGFLPGTSVPGSPRVYEVRADRAHTWPELHFAGVGWVRFEPTPAVQSGLPPAYADPFAVTGEAPAPDDEIPQATATPSAVPTTGPTSPTGAPTASSSRGSWWPLALVVLAGAGAVAGAVVLRRRRRAPEPLDPESAWALLRGRLARFGVTWQDSLTPRRAAESIERQLVRRRGEPLDAASADALTLLATSLETRRYAPRPVVVEPHELETAVARVVAAVTSTGRDADGAAAGRLSTKELQRPRS